MSIFTNHSYRGADVGIINLVAEHPSMAHMEQVGLKADKDKEVAEPICEYGKYTRLIWFPKVCSSTGRLTR